MSKLLRAYTIIPPELYIQRDADRQLARVLQDMGRPGYVLVARQMGKTNLLLNARSALQQAADAFVYIDLSNPFPSARDCFRNITDAIVESNPLRFALHNEMIAKGRLQNSPPHKEHEAELRRLLGSVAGRLVIILDEIDALTSSTFSDQIFAQIRSTYFSRANISDFARLTYVLSGVAEPSELIRNPKLSPFNIGEKIYLDDFTRDEFARFVDKSQIQIDDDAREAIYRWVSGNPRMTWDVCSEIEDLQATGTRMSVLQIDDVVKKLYLTSFDRPPVDHIRTLAENSSEIRNALVEMRYGKGASVSDSTRAKLYLAGITSSHSNPLRVKNAVIDGVLSEQWLRDIERKRLGLLKLAEEHVAQGRAEEAIRVAREFLSEGRNPESERLLAIDLISSAQYSLGLYLESIDTLNEGMFDKTTLPGVFLKQRNRQAQAAFLMGDFAKSIDLFREVLSGNASVQVRLSARINLAVAKSESAGASEYPEILAEYQSLIVELDSDATTDTTWRESLVAVRYNTAVLLRKMGRADEAVVQLEAGLATANKIERAALLIELAGGAAPLKRTELVREAVELVTSHDLRPSGPLRSTFDLTEKRFGQLLSMSFEIDEATSFSALLKYCVQADIRAGTLSFAPVYAHLLTTVAPRGRNTLSRLNGIIDAAVGESDHEFRYFFAKTFAYYGIRASGRFVRSPGYVRLVAQQPRSLDDLDIHILYREVGELVGQHDLDASSRLLESLEMHRTSTRAEYFLLFDYYQMTIASMTGRELDERTFARRALECVEEHSQFPLSDDDIRTIRSAAQAALSPPLAQRVEVRLGRKYGRNELVAVRYSDGQVRTKKYKYVERDLREGRCTLAPE